MSCVASAALSCFFQLPFALTLAWRGILFVILFVVCIGSGQAVWDFMPLYPGQARSSSWLRGGKFTLEQGGTKFSTVTRIPR
jgi:hypothetical protein